MRTVPTGHRSSFPRLVARTRWLRDEVAAGEVISSSEAVWISSGTTLAATGAVFEFVPSLSRGRFDEASEVLSSVFEKADIDDEVDAPGSGPVAAGTFTFDWRDGGSRIVVPEVVIGRNEAGVWRTDIRCEPQEVKGPPISRQEADLHAPRAERAGVRSAFGEWQDKFEQVDDLLGSGDLQKLVLARKVEVPLPARFDPPALVRALARQFPDCYTFRFGSLVGASPELLVRRLGDVVDSSPIAGCAPRGRDEAEDERLGFGLRASEKNRREHELTKGAVLSALAPYCLSLEAESEPSLLLLSNVQHLSTKVQGKLKDAPDCLRLVGALHPTPAVCGLPPDGALKVIRSVEGFSRGRYAGPIGWMDYRGDGEWAIALRCAELGASSAALFAGAGIVAGSDASGEFAETELKLEAVRSALVAGLKGGCV